MIKFYDYIDAKNLPSDIDAGFFFMTDFIAAAGELTSQTSGTGSQVSYTGTSSTQNHIGIVRLATGSTSVGRAAIGSTANLIVFGGGEIKFRSVAMLQTLSDATDTYTARIGFIDSLSTESADGAFFRYTDSVASGNWQAVTRVNNVQTSIDTGINVVANEWYNFEIIGNEAGDAILFYINKMLVATISTNIPTATSRETSFGAYIQKTLGTANRYFNVDYFFVRKMFLQSR